MNTKLSFKGPRIGAAIIDFIISFGIMTIVVFTRFINVNIGHDLVSIILTLLIPITVLSYYTIIPYFTKGSTIGKLIVGLRVQTIDYENPSFKRLFIRNVFFFHQMIPVPFKIYNYINHSFFNQFSIIIAIAHISFFILYFIIFIMILATDEERGFHDMLGGTIVIDRNISIEQINRATILEMRDMAWAEFEGLPEHQQPGEVFNSNVSMVDDDEILILKDEDEN